MATKLNYIYRCRVTGVRPILVQLYNFNILGIVIETFRQKRKRGNTVGRLEDFPESTVQLKLELRYVFFSSEVLKKVTRLIMNLINW